MKHDFQSIVSDTIPLVERAGSIALDYYTGEYAVKSKADDSLVTEADHAVHNYLMNALETFDFPIVSEEGTSSSRTISPETYWVVDPIDGTQQFVQQDGLFKVYVALVHANTPVLGIINSPLTGRTYYASSRNGAYVRNGVEETEIQLASHYPYGIIVREERDGLVDTLHANLEDVAVTRAGFSTVSLFNGTFHAKVVTEGGGYAWDVCAPQAILREAGGRVTNVNGDKLSYEYDTIRSHEYNGTIKTVGKRHEEIVEAVS